MPRAGSTWLQRVISSHPDVATCAEPWILLPLLSAMGQCRTVAEYDQELCVLALRSFLGDDGDDELWKRNYSRIVREASLSCYAERAYGKPYFLDKTPRYSLICNQVIDTFPNGKYIFLWRHPISVVASICKTWGGSQWSHRYDVDMIAGLREMLSAVDRCQSQILEVQYEKLILSPVETLETISSYLGIQITMTQLADAQTRKVEGRMGDPNQYSQPSAAISDWHIAAKEFVTTRFRRKWLINRLSNIGQVAMSRMGYSLDDAIASIETAESRGLGASEAFAYYSVLARRLAIEKASNSKHYRSSLLFSYR